MFKNMKFFLIFLLLPLNLVIGETNDPLLDRASLVTFEKLISKSQIEQRLQEIAAIVDQYYENEELTLVVLMKGGICIGADLLRSLQTPCFLEYIKTCSYGANGDKRGELSIIGLEKIDIKDKNILVVDDIFDSGNTLSKVVKKIEESNPKSLRSLVFLSKNIERKITYKPDFVLFDVEDRFIVGYGMDYKEYWRGLPEVYAIR